MPSAENVAWQRGRDFPPEPLLAHWHRSDQRFCYPTPEGRWEYERNGRWIDCADEPDVIYPPGTRPIPPGVTSVEPGCTCGGMAACPQCQERDATTARTGPMPSAEKDTPPLRVQIETRDAESSTCKVWRGDVLIFDGVSWSALTSVTPPIPSGDTDA